MDLPEEAKRAPSAPVWNQSFPSPKALFVRCTFFIWCYPLVHSRGRSSIRNLGTRVAAVVPQLASGTAVPLPLTPRMILIIIIIIYNNKNNSVVIFIIIIVMIIIIIELRYIAVMLMKRLTTWLWCISGEAGAACLFMFIRRVSVQHGTRPQCTACSPADDVGLDSSFTAEHQICQRALSAVDAAAGLLSLLVHYVLF